MAAHVRHCEVSPSVSFAVSGNTILSSAEFFEAAIHPLPAVAVFDCDGTLWSGDAGSAFMRWSIETGLVSREMVDWLDARYRGYLRGEVSEAAICGEMVQVYQGLREEELRGAARSFFSTHMEPKIFPAMRELVERLRTAGTELWAVSSTNDWVVEEGVQRLGFDAAHVLAARVRVRHGVITNELLAVPTDDAKVTALRGVGVTQLGPVFGNSVHDAAMLRVADRPFAVNPTPALRELAAREGWPIFEPHDAERVPV